MNSFINWLSKRDSKVYKEVKSFYETDASSSNMGHSYSASNYARMNATTLQNLMRSINNRSITSKKLDEIIKSLESAEEQLLHQKHNMESQGKLAEFNDYMSKIEKALEAAHDRWNDLNP